MQQGQQAKALAHRSFRSWPPPPQQLLQQQKDH
jgi:hypothetical protein